jgi:hypothetical protein
MAWLAGDIAIVSASHNNGFFAPAAPDGWTNIGNGAASTAGAGSGIGMRSAYRILDGSEVNAGYWGWSGSNPYVQGLVTIYRGVHQTTPIGTVSGASAIGSPFTTFTWGAINPTVNEDSWVVAVSWHNYATAMTTAPEGLTYRIHKLATNGDVTLHDSNGGTEGWAGGSVVNGYTGDGGRLSFELRAADGEEISFVESHHTSGRGYGFPIVLPEEGTVSGTFSQAVIVG